MIEIEIALIGVPPSPNGRLHWRRLAAERKEWRTSTFLSAIQAIRSGGHGGDFPLDRIEVQPVFTFRTRRRRDTDNLVAMLKPLLDGLVDANVVPDDTLERVRILHPMISSGVDSIRLLVREAA